MIKVATVLSIGFGDLDPRTRTRPNFPRRSWSIVVHLFRRAHKVFELQIVHYLLLELCKFIHDIIRYG